MASPLTRNPGPSGTRGFTLLELMIALALGMIISVMVSQVSSQAQKIYKNMTQTVELYQKFRYAIGDMRSEIENWVLTADLEYFVDSQGGDRENGHWDDGEEIKKPANLDGGTRGKYDEAAMIVERTYTVQSDRGDSEHECFSIYFKTRTTINGKERVANVEYYLADPNLDLDSPLEETVEDYDAGTLVLVKKLRWLYTDKDQLKKTEREVVTKTVELCQNVTDLRFEYLYDNEYDSYSGRFMTPGLERRQQGVKSEVLPEIRRGDGAIVKSFMYGGFRNMRVRGKATRERRSVNSGELEPLAFRMATGPETGINFSELHQGDSIYIWNEANIGEFRAGEYTIFQKVKGQLQFVEEIDSSTWKDDEQAALRYKAGTMPSAIRITIRVLDSEGYRPRMFQTVVRPFRKRS